MTRKYFYILLLVLASAGFLLRMQVCRELRQNDIQVTAPSSFTDMATYKDLSEKMMKGEYLGEFYYQPLYYAVFLPCVHKILGNGIWPVMIAQSLLSALTIFFAALCSAMLWGRRAGVFTAFLVAFSAVLILYVPYHLIETLQAFWITMILYVAILAWRSGKSVHWAILGFLVSMSILTRGNSWFFVPGLMVAAYFSVRIKPDGKSYWTLKNISARLLPVVLFFIMVILPQLPFSIWNTKVTGKFCGPSTAAGSVLALGNTPEAPPGGRNPGTGAGPMEYPETYAVWTGTAKDIPVSKRMYAWFKEEPLAFLELQFRKMLLFWDSHEIPNNIAFEYQGRKSSAFKLMAFIPTAIIMILALAWLFYYFVYHARKKFAKIVAHPEFLILSYMIISYFLATAAFYILARFRLPCVPLLAVGAGGFAVVFLDSLRRHNWRQLILRSAVPLLIASFIVYLGYDFYRYNYEAPVMKIVRPHGIRTELGDGRILYLDNGPVSFGSWAPIDIRQGDVILKKFAIRDPIEGRNAEFAIPITSETQGVIKMEINGKAIQYKIRPGLNEQLFEIPFDALNPQVVIKFLYVYCNAYSIFDFQRNYGRSELNGKNLGAELVSKLYISTGKKPMNKPTGE